MKFFTRSTYVGESRRDSRRRQRVGSFPTKRSSPNMPRRKKPRLGWTEPAEHDLDSIRAFIARDSPGNAGRFIARIRRAVANLRNFPFSGEVLAGDEDSELREIYVNSYRVIFRRRDDSILV